MPARRPTLSVIAIAGVMIALGSTTAGADGMPQRGWRGNVDVRVENGVRVWRPRVEPAATGRATGVTSEGLAAHMFAGHALHAPHPGFVVVPVETPVYVGGGGSRFFAPARPGAVRQMPQMGPLVGSSARAAPRSTGVPARAAARHPGR